MGDSATIRKNFESFNTYAVSAQDTSNEDRDIDANLAVAFELSQLRFQLRRMLGGSPDDGRREVSARARARE
jgi:hypothetical protein